MIQAFLNIRLQSKSASLTFCFTIYCLLVYDILNAVTNNYTIFNMLMPYVVYEINIQLIAPFEHTYYAFHYSCNHMSKDDSL